MRVLKSRPKGVIRHLFKAVSFFLVGVLLSTLLVYLHTPVMPVGAQVQVTNTASGAFDDPTNPNRPRVRAPSNPTTIGTPPVENQLLRITKTADKSAAEPGDIVIYRLLVENISAVAATPLTVMDNLPRGLEYIDDSVNSAPIPPNLTNFEVAGRQLNFQFDSLPANSLLEILYAVTLTPDSVRGSGVNVATASAPGFPTAQAEFSLTIRPGILSDCGTIIGRVFVDKNFDGEQQSGEAGVPNAVIYLDDGNRIIADPDGLFSMANVVSGNRVGVLDLSSLPGYTLAPNLYRLENNSQSRLVRLEPGGLARMNFAVTPTFGEGQN
ncbi:DUF11 domain-containing protein [Leptolyngbyaceae cyanobacterium CCMR0082]|uniref:DUF11 domain-containing protein n=1 Tax=Adonisia turfae CCMR0082 TaxID=2304604 RepID=A0A6M0SDG8_9CYAN|nr:DUF11 domain-containing protein [Adonisia turfae]MDV3351075.1 DUF11 domain-containing protein [Leptothoe sp. LEGE 181152]NEZ66539.1 DUF11 domain-containing protein [Adonisia turfae CCMR0082]